jgi:pyruvate formate lyase activating enzyme
VIVRDWYEILDYALTPEGRCQHCNAQLPGRYERFERAWGRKRVPMHIHAAT